MKKDSETEKISRTSGAKIVTIVLIVLLPLIFAAGLFIGAETVPLKEAVNCLLGKSDDSFTEIIIKDIRLPRVILALICGALLSGAGAVFQGFFKSPLADSSMLGVSSGAALGAIAGSMLRIWMPLAAFSGAIFSILLVYMFSGGQRSASEPTKLLLAGNAVSVFFSAMSSAILLIKDKELYTMYAWTLGSFNGKGWTELSFIAVPAVISLFLFLLCIKPLDVLAAGNLSSQSMGISLKKTRTLCFAAGSLAAATAVCAGGVIGFAGLIAPHIIRLLTGSRHKTLIPLSLAGGAVFLGFVDILCRVAAPPLDIPAGIVTSLFGAPFFIFILLNHNRRSFA